MQPKLFGALVLLLALLSVLQAYETGVTNYCSTSNDPTNSFVKKGELTYVCLNINNKYRTIFTPLADQFTVLRVPGSFNDSRIGGEPWGAFLSVSSLNMSTNYKLYSSSKGNVFPYFTALISVKKGVITGVTWDDGCFFCESDSCSSNLFKAPSNKSSQIYSDNSDTCYFPKTSCLGANASSCDITVYVGWTGTDKKGNYLSSSGKRISQFQKYSVGNYFKNFKSQFTVFVPTSRLD